MAPSWSFTPYACTNGVALAGLCIGIVAVVTAFPWGPFGVLPGVLGGALAIVAGGAGRRRVRSRSWIGGVRLSLVAIGLGVGAIALALVGSGAGTG